jgi:hypothetical protein
MNLAFNTQKLLLPHITSEASALLCCGSPLTWQCVYLKQFGNSPSLPSSPSVSSGAMLTTWLIPRCCNTWQLRALATPPTKRCGRIWDGRWASAPARTRPMRSNTCSSRTCTAKEEAEYGSATAPGTPALQINQIGTVGWAPYRQATTCEDSMPQRLGKSLFYNF